MELQQEVLEPLSIYLYTRFGICDGISFVDATPVPVTTIAESQHIKSLLNRHPLARTLSAGSTKSTLNVRMAFSWFKLHLCVNTSGELLGVEFTPATTDDRKVVPKLEINLYGKLYADKGYISQILREYLRTQGIELVYRVRKNMKPHPLSDFDALMLKKRMLIESVIKE